MVFGVVFSGYTLFPEILNPEPWIHLLDTAGTEGARFNHPLNRQLRCFKWTFRVWQGRNGIRTSSLQVVKG